MDENKSKTKKDIATALIIVLVVGLIFTYFVVPPKTSDYDFQYDFTYVSTIDGLRFDLTNEKLEQAFKDAEASINLLFDGIETIKAIFYMQKMNQAIDYIATQHRIATIYYYSDGTNQKYVDNYLYATEALMAIRDLYIGGLRKIYYESPMGEELFSEFSEDELKLITGHSEEATQLELANEQLVVEQQALDNDGLRQHGGRLLSQLVNNNQQIASLNGYANYYKYAHDLVYTRDYSNNNLIDFRILVATYMPSYFMKAKADYETALANLNEQEKAEFNNFLMSYVNNPNSNYFVDYANSAPSNMKKTLLNAINKNHMYFANENGLEGAFTTQLPMYDHSYCYFSQGYNDDMTIAHELGHYYGTTYQDMGAMDLMETQSQGNELLFLHYLKQNATVENRKFVNLLEKQQLYTFARIILMATIVDDFEYNVYNSPASALNDAYFDNVLENVCVKYGGIDFVNENIVDIGLYVRKVCMGSPCYYISYAVSAVAAMNIYEIAENKYTLAGFEAYTTLVEKVDGTEFLSALQQANVPSPVTGDAFDVFAN
ncbi:MAG: hypothetical protein IJD18_04870 [Clostridia bacterium]|nr:hypothetical protein [Clostridia bacterium]